ncbi:SDR family oxidoreductase [Dermacoccus abyssi]|jgi:short-subunit dehydrogenase|uniref:SDR family NAD(P)-dependent oxidoreductase n=1 Tax=Dermacoccus abyssi TaxID=322596 RepID=UPI0021A6E325|nr:SDR family oxidoreductase [Dermacoccus abyssi]MCT1986238.1 SDR family oxidoreductase [Dermacoccus abyssi]
MKTALVTGASAGIGREFCEQFAARGDNVVVVARNAERLEELKAHLEGRYKVDVEVLAADLTDAGDLQRVAERVAQRENPVEILVNNAGFGVKTSFLDTPVEKEVEALDVMVKAVVVLTHAAAGAMVARGRGAIINVSSVASFLASGTYSAAKSYVTVFSESIAAQLHGSGVSVTALCPGFTHTEFHERGGISVDKSSPLAKRLWLDADRLVRDCLADVEAGRVISVPGRQYKAITGVLRVVPRPLVRSHRLSNRHRPSK